MHLPCNLQPRGHFPIVPLTVVHAPPPVISLVDQARAAPHRSHHAGLLDAYISPYHPASAPSLYFSSIPVDDSSHHQNRATTSLSPALSLSPPGYARSTVTIGASARTVARRIFTHRCGRAASTSGTRRKKDARTVPSPHPSQLFSPWLITLFCHAS